MDKYKYFLLLFSGIILLLFWNNFPICYDNNDDHVMLGISSGLFSGVPSSNLVLTNIFIGKFVEQLYRFSYKINWYTLYLQSLLLLCFLTTCYLCVKDKSISIISSVLLVLFILFGIFLLCVVKLQFTTVALFCSFTGLLCLQYLTKWKTVLMLFFIAVSFLIRKDTFYLSLLFIIPILLSQDHKYDFIRRHTASVIFLSIIFFASLYINNNNAAYKNHHTYSNTNALDIIAAKPIKINHEILLKNKMTIDDVILLQSWFVADNAYLTGNKIEEIASSLKVNRNMYEVESELIKFVKDERYIILVYVLSILMIFLFAKKSLKICLLNLIVFLFVLLYLTVTARIPHRVTFPIISYLIVLNLFCFIRNDNKNLQIAFLSLFFIIGCYKAYCTSKLYNMQTENHKIFASYKEEINRNPGNVFIALDAFPIQYMDAWQLPQDIFPAHNVIMNGWYACSPDYQVLLNKHDLKNLTIDLKNKNDVLFLTNSEILQNAYLNVIKQRYNMDCHFEAVSGFKYLQPKKLVINQ